MEVIHRIPAGLWANLQTLVSRVDHQFLQEVSRITKLPMSELKKAVPTFGVSTRITTEGSEPWWTGQQCRMSVRGLGGMWIRCSGTAFEGPCCFKHRSLMNRDIGRLPPGIRPYDDPYFIKLPQRKPIRIEGVVYWTDDTGNLYNVRGCVVEGMKIDSTYGIVCIVTKN